jgi:hypothetical protein
MTDKVFAKKNLQPYERHAACFLIAVLLGLGITGMRNKEIPLANSVPVIQVKVVGAVESTELILPLGSTVDDVIQRVHLLSDADISELNGMKKLRTSETLVIPFCGKKTFFVCGAVQEPKLVVLEEVTAQKILDQIQVDDTANVKAFLRRRVFPNGSIIQVKPKKLKTKPSQTT